MNDHDDQPVRVWSPARAAVVCAAMVVAAAIAILPATFEAATHDRATDVALLMSTFVLVSLAAFTFQAGANALLSNRRTDKELTEIREVLEELLAVLKTLAPPDEPPQLKAVPELPEASETSS